MSMQRRSDDEVSQINSIAETKGIDIDTIDVEETTTDDGDDLLVFRVYETKADTETDSVGVQISKLVNSPAGDMTFRNDVQQKLTALKRHVSGETDGDVVAADTEDGADDQPTEATDTQQTTDRDGTSQSVTVPDADTPGATLDAQIAAIEDRLDVIEDRLDVIEDKSEALDGLQQLMQSNE